MELTDKEIQTAIAEYLIECAAEFYMLRLVGPEFVEECKDNLEEPRKELKELEH